MIIFIKLSKRNPYMIADRVSGIGFKMVDGIAVQSGVSADSEFVYSLQFFISESVYELWDICIFRKIC